MVKRGKRSRMKKSLMVGGGVGAAVEKDVNYLERGESYLAFALSIGHYVGIKAP